MKLILLLAISVMLTGATVAGRTQTETWQALLARADSLVKVAQYDSAEALANRALAMTESAYGTEDTSVANAVTVKGKIFYYQGRSIEAEAFFRRGMDIREKKLGPDSPSLAASVNCVANAVNQQGRIREAEQLYHRALDIAERRLGVDHPLSSSILGNLSNLFIDQGRYQEAEDYARRSFEVLQRTKGPDSWEAGMVLNILARALQYSGRYPEAEPEFRRALEIMELRTGAQSNYSSLVMNNLATLLQDEGRLAEAEPLLRHALEFIEIRHGPTNSQLTFPLQNLARLVGAQGNFMEAEQLLRRALDIAEQNRGPVHADVARCLENLSVVLFEEGRSSEAEPLCRRALDIWEQLVGPTHLEVSLCLVVLMGILIEQERLVEAEAVSDRVIEVTEQVLGKKHPYRAKGLSWAAYLHQRLGHMDQAQSIAQEAWQIALDNFRENHCVLAERAMFDLAQNLSSFSSRSLTILLADGAALSADATARVVFSTKGRVTDAIIARQQTWHEDDSLTAHLAESLRDARFSLSRLYIDGPGKDSMQVYRHKLDSATREKEQLETELASRSARFAREGELWDVDAHKVSTSMPTGSLLVEFMCYHRRQGLKVNDDEPQYLAIVLKAGESPRVFPLGPAAGIDTAIRYYRQQFRDPQNLDSTAYAAASENLYSLVWRPFAALLKGATTVFIAPDGNLNLVSFAGLVDDDHKYLIENYPIHYLSTGRDLLRLQDNPLSGNGLLAMGDPDFDLLFEKSSVATLGQALLTSLNLRSSCEALNKLNVSPLPGTQKEVEAVMSQWRNSGGTAASYFGSDATEENFKRNAPGQRVLHLATHGFYISDECQKKLNTRSSLGIQEGGYVGENPLLLSGLLLAGANRHGEGANEAQREDGIVTAEEVAGMNLRGTDLVVLSACETGLGTVKSGEGVYGLRRAFQMAGARTVISALWPIDDKATAEFMGQLFTAQDETLPQTMQRIALSRISFLRSQGKSDHPFYWAAFVATGDWEIQ